MKLSSWKCLKSTSLSSSVIINSLSLVSSPLLTHDPKMLQNRVVSLEAREGLDAKLIVFLNYQGLFLVFSKATIDIYNSLLKRTNSFLPLSALTIVYKRILNTLITRMITLPTFLPIKTFSSVTIAIGSEQESLICLIY